MNSLERLESLPILFIQGLRVDLKYLLALYISFHHFLVYTKPVLSTQVNDERKCTEPVGILAHSRITYTRMSCNHREVLVNRSANNLYAVAFQNFRKV